MTGRQYRGPLHQRILLLNGLYIVLFSSSTGYQVDIINLSIIVTMAKLHALHVTRPSFPRFRSKLIATRVLGTIAPYTHTYVYYLAFYTSIQPSHHTSVLHLHSHNRQPSPQPRSFSCSPNTNRHRVRFFFRRGKWKRATDFALTVAAPRAGADKSLMVRNCKRGTRLLQ